VHRCASSLSRFVHSCFILCLFSCIKSCVTPAHGGNLPKRERKNERSATKSGWYIPFDEKKKKKTRRCCCLHDICSPIFTLARNTCLCRTPLDEGIQLVRASGAVEGCVGYTPFFFFCMHCVLRVCEDSFKQPFFGGVISGTQAEMHLVC
jgi:hypothetical protein